MASSVVARRQLIEAAQKLAKTNSVEPEHYEALLLAVAAVYSIDTGAECDCVLIKKREK